MSRFSKGFIAVATLVAVTLASSQQSSAASSWSFTDDVANVGLTGTSPHVERNGSLDRVWYNGGAVGAAIADCSAAGSCTAVAANWGTPINDITFATFGGVKRAYFKKWIQCRARKRCIPHRASQQSVYPLVQQR